MTVEITGEQRSIRRVLGDDFMFYVPPYQRPYAWTTEHAGQLLDDLLDFLEDDDTGRPIANLTPYFLGSIVLIKGSTPNAEIVDGQQRLITLTILLSALRALVPADYMLGIGKLIYDEEDKAAGLPARFRLRPKPQDAEFFEQYIQRAGRIESLRTVNTATISDSKRNMRDNALLYLDRLRDLPEQRRTRLVQFIIQRCLLVVVSTPDLDSAYRIFSVLNDRGLDLSAADILKAQVIGQISPQAQNSYTEKWESTEEDLGRDDFEKLLSHIRMLYRQQKARDTILKEFRDYVMSKVPDPRHLVDEVLLPYADAFEIITDESYQHTHGAGAVNAQLRWLNRIPDSDWLPPALLYLQKHRNDPARLARFFTDLERLAAVLMMRRTNINKRIERHARLLAAIEQGDDLSAPSSPIQLTTDERREALHTLDGDLYRQSARTRQYVLLRLDAALSSGDAVYTYPTISIEHVLPQNPAPGSQWVKWFPTPQQREQWVHRLGNLVLLSRRKNAQAGNYDFDKKKNSYFATAGGVSPFALTTQVIKERVWTPEVVERRQNELIAGLRQLWRL